MKKNLVFVFDFDGVLVDSISLLYNVYYDFLREFGIKGNRNECEFLNGPKIKEIVSYLKSKYDLNGKESELLEIYHNKISLAYKDVALNEGVETILKWLSENNVKLALASSSKKDAIMAVLKKFKINAYFDFIISGDDVKEAKPSPEIYNSVRSEFPNSDFFVIEDSKNGIDSAIQAGMRAILYGSDTVNDNPNILYSIDSLLEIKNIFIENELNCFTVCRSKKISLKISDYSLDISELKLNAIEEIWSDASQNKKVFNGRIVSYKSHSEINDELVVDCFLTQYKYFYAQFKDPNLGLDIKPIGVSGIVVDGNHDTLLALRKNVTEYNGYYELVPAGGIDASKEVKEEVLFINQLVDEFEEETSIPKENINKIAPFCMVFDKNHGVYDICCAIYTDGFLKDQLKIKSNLEYSNIKIIPLDDFDNGAIKEKMIPGSIVVYNNFLLN